MKGDFLSQTQTESKVELVCGDSKSVLDVVKEVAQRATQDDPFFVVDLADIVLKHKLWKLKLPRVSPFYAVKCNDCPVVLEFLAALGVNFDCASKSEIQAVLSAGVAPSRIIYANPCKTRSFIKYAANVNVDLMTFDNEVELHKVKELFPEARLVLRIRVDDSHSHFKLGLKFGCELAEAEQLLVTAQRLHLNVVGVSFHVGSGCQDASSFTQAIADARTVFDIAESLGIPMSLLDIGGGFPGKLEQHPHAQFEDMAEVINEALDAWFPEESGVKVIAEPGRYYVTSAFTLAANIIAKRESVMDDTIMYYLNDGVYGSFNCVIYEPTAFHPIPFRASGEEHGGKAHRSSLWGPTCDSLDRVMEEAYLPNMEVGDWLVFHNMGAYSVTSATTFNGFPKSSVLCFILPTHIQVYLQQLPGWSDLVAKLQPPSASHDLAADPPLLLPISAGGAI